jgi:hypothetical protein
MAPSGPDEPLAVVPVSQTPAAESHAQATPAWGARERAKALLMAPAITLLVVGLLGLLVDAFQLVQGVKIPEGYKDFVKKNFQAEPPTEESVTYLIAAFASVSFVIVLGAIQMLRARMYPLAIAASLLAMINIGNACCCLGLPVGIWSLVILMRSDVRVLFQRLPSQAA